MGHPTTGQPLPRKAGVGRRHRLHPHDQPRGLWTTIAVFWPTVAALASGWVLKGWRACFVLLAMLAMAASWQSVVVATGMIGI
ncbi:MAG: hypothetical protein GY898_10400 [Proteobacteria bacterium]|nr:hypothetical protein [Pseudomonadota bacterium]